MSENQVVEIRMVSTAGDTLQTMFVNDAVAFLKKQMTQAHMYFADGKFVPPDSITPETVAGAKTHTVTGALAGGGSCCPSDEEVLAKLETQMKAMQDQINSLKGKKVQPKKESSCCGSVVPEALCPFTPIEFNRVDTQAMRSLHINMIYRTLRTKKNDKERAALLKEINPPKEYVDIINRAFARAKLRPEAVEDKKFAYIRRNVIRSITDKNVRAFYAVNALKDKDHVAVGQTDKEYLNSLGFAKDEVPQVLDQLRAK